MLSTANILIQTLLKLKNHSTNFEKRSSLYERSVEEEGILDTIQELGIGFVAYSPLGRGFLSGDIQKAHDFPEGDFRRSIPKFQGEQFYKNIALVKAIKQLAAEKNVATPQLALAVLSKGFVPIPGTKRRKRLEQNIEAAAITLLPDEIEKLESVIPLGTVTGNRYDALGMTMVGQ